MKPTPEKTLKTFSESQPQQPAPLFSIITVTRNNLAALRRTISSIAEQTCRDFEYVVIDGDSTDGTPDFLREIAPTISAMKWVSEPDSGIYDAMNKGLTRTCGKYVIFLNSGDTFHSAHTLSHIAEKARQIPAPGVIYGQTDIVDSDGRHLGPRHLSAPEELTLKSFANGMVVCHQAFIANRSITSRFDTDFRLSSDYDWCVRCLQHSRLNVYIDEVLIDYQYNGASTANRRVSLAERFSIMCRYYGVLPTVWRHIWFLPRFLKRRKLERTFKSA